MKEPTIKEFLFDMAWMTGGISAGVYVLFFVIPTVWI